MPAPEDAAVPPLVRKAAAWSWRLLVILGLVVAVLWVFKHLEVIVVPVALATMLTALLLAWRRLGWTGAAFRAAGAVACCC